MIGDGQALQKIAPQRRVVLLGASNLTKGIGTVLETAIRMWGGPQQVFVALGHGRSYGRTSRVLAVRLPGIECCDLWQDLAAAEPLPTAALVTDIGNDLLYEEPVDQILEWVDRCLDRLAAIGARTTITLLPTGNLPALGNARFRLIRTLFFPSSRITLAEVTRRALALNEGVRRLAAERGCEIAEFRSAWYGFDPIHIRFGHRREAWREILARWVDADVTHPAATHAIARTLYLRTRTPAQRGLLWLDQRGRKPAATFADGTTVSIY